MIQTGDNMTDTQTMISEETHFIDGAFTVDQQRWGTYQSYDTEGNKIITSLSEDVCIRATRWFLKARQDGFTDPTATYDGSVGGKL